MIHRPSDSRSLTVNDEPMFVTSDWIKTSSDSSADRPTTWSTSCYATPAPETLARLRPGLEPSWLIRRCLSKVKRGAKSLPLLRIPMSPGRPGNAVPCSAMIPMASSCLVQQSFGSGPASRCGEALNIAFAQRYNLHSVVLNPPQ